MEKEEKLSGKYPKSESQRKKIGDTLREYFKDAKVKEGLSLRNSGTRNPRYGKPLSIEKRKEMHEKMLGEKNHQYKEGKFIGDHDYRKERYETKHYDFNFNNKFKEQIRKRDNQVCMNCGIHREKLNKSFVVHHINYDSALTIKENCITLCLVCHGLTNTNREYWIELFQNKLSNLYGYKYENHKAVLNITEGVVKN